MTDKKSSIPSAEEFARADRLMKDRFRNLHEIRKCVMRRFEGSCPLHNFYILPQGDASFLALVFFNEDEDIEICKSGGIHQELVDFVYEELERAGSGMRGDIAVAFEFDSFQNVTAKFGGSYGLRLR